MGRHLALFGFVTTCLVASPSRIAATEPLTLERVLDAVRTRNPAVAGATARARAAASIPARVAAYDDPVVSWEAWNIPESFAIDRADNNIVRLAQRIPFPGKRTLAGEMAARDADAMRYDATAVGLDAEALAKRLYVDLWRAHEMHAVTAEDFALVQRVARVVEGRYGTGDATQADVLRVQVEVSHMASALRTTALAIDDAKAGLVAVMSDPDAALGDPVAPPPPSLPPSVESLVARALTERPEVAARDAVLEREHTGVRLARKGYLPDFELSVGRFVNASVPDGFGAMASMTVPLAWKGKYDAGVAEAGARLASAEADRRRTTDEIRRDVQQAYLRAKTALVQHQLFGDTHVPHAAQVLHVTEAAYGAGAGDLTALLEALRAALRVHLEHVQAGAEFELRFAELERAVGSPVDRARTSRSGGHRHD